MHSNPKFDPKASYFTSWFSYRLTKIEEIGLAWHGSLFSPGNRQEWIITGSSLDDLKKAAEARVVIDLTRKQTEDPGIPENVYFDIDKMKAKYDL